MSKFCIEDLDHTLGWLQLWSNLSSCTKFCLNIVWPYPLYCVYGTILHSSSCWDHIVSNTCRNCSHITRLSVLGVNSVSSRYTGKLFIQEKHHFNTETLRCCRPYMSSSPRRQTFFSKHTKVCFKAATLSICL